MGKKKRTFEDWIKAQGYKPYEEIVIYVKENSIKHITQLKKEYEDYISHK